MSRYSLRKDIAYAPDVPLDESCYREARNADVFVLIVGGPCNGSEKSEAKQELPKDFYQRYDSITKQEYKSALEGDIPICNLIEKSVYADFETYLRANKGNQGVVYALQLWQVRLLMYSSRTPQHIRLRQGYGGGTGGPPTSSAGPRQPRACASGHQPSPANRVRGATTSGFVGRIMTGGSASRQADPCHYRWPPRNPSSPFLHPIERGLACPP